VRESQSNAALPSWTAMGNYVTIVALT